MLLLASVQPALATFAGPTDAKAQKTLEAIKAPGVHRTSAELIDLYEKANKQDGHHCGTCVLEIVKLAQKSGDFDRAHKAAVELEGLAASPEDQAMAHLLHGRAALDLALNHKKPALLTEADAQFQQVLQLDPHSKEALLQDGIALANLQQDDAARQRFEQYLTTAQPGVLAQRVARYAKRPELARERLAPPFQLTTLNGHRIALEDLQGKVLLIDFWATWCGPCREALPHVQHLAQHFAGQPLVVLSVSLDEDEAAWKAFLEKNHMDWEQYRDGGFTGPLAQTFGVRAIPATFTIDPDGVVQDQHVGDADVEGKLKKLLQKATAAAEAPRPAGS